MSRYALFLLLAGSLFAQAGRTVPASKPEPTGAPAAPAPAPAPEPPAAPPAAPAPAPAKPGRATSFQDSLRQQQESVSRQLDGLREQYPSYWNQPPVTATGPAPAITAQPIAVQSAANCPPVPLSELRGLVDQEARRNALSPTLLHAVIEQESAGLPCAVSNKGAMGLMQLMPATAETLRVQDPFDPAQNIAAGSRFLKQLLERYGGDVGKALAAYNAGPGRVDAAGDIPPIPETIQYVDRILTRVGQREKAIQ